MTTLDPRSSYRGAAAPAGTSSSGPSTRWYWLAGILAVLGLLAAVGWGGLRLLSAIDEPRDFARAPTPGMVSVTVPGFSTQIVYYEGDRATPVAALDLTVTGPSGAAVTASTYRQKLQYDVPGRNGMVGTAVASFRADIAGAYRVSTTAAALDPGATLAVGPNVAHNAVGRLVGPGVLGLGTLVAAGAVAAATAVRRSRPRGRPA